jgi:hypothetical protein
MTTVFYLKEKRWEFLAKLIVYQLRLKGIPVEWSDDLGAHPSQLPKENMYLLTGAEYLHEFPPQYIIIQTIPTSPITKTQGLDAYWMTQPYLHALSKARAVWELAPTQTSLWKNHPRLGLDNVWTIPLAGRSHFYKDFLQALQSTQITLSNPTSKASEEESPMVIWTSSTKRGQTLQKQHPDSPAIWMGLHDPLEVIRTAYRSRSTLFVVQEYTDTIPSIDICLLARAASIPCVVEIPKDGDHVLFLRSIGCEVLPLSRIRKQIRPRPWPTSVNTTPGDVIREKPSLETLPEWTAMIQQAGLLDSTTSLTDSSQGVQSDTSNTSNKGKKSKKSKKNKKKALKLYHRKPLDTVPLDRFQDGGIRLRLPDIPDEKLPPISICTPTGNRRWVFSLSWRNIIQCFYPKHLIEWVILDDGEESIQDIIPRDDRIQYHFIGGEGKTRLPMGEKRNRLVELASHDIVVFMDDDDYYPPESATARVKSLLQTDTTASSKIQCVGCSDYLIYDIVSDKWGEASQGQEYLSEASMAFYKSFWRERSFLPSDQVGEFRQFLEYRQDQVRTIPSQFVTVAFSHGQNTTGGVRSLANTDHDIDPKLQESLDSIFEEEYKWFLHQLSKTVASQTK